MIFSAHSLPVRTLDDGSQRCKYCDCDDGCRYRDGLQETADLVAERLGLERYVIAWQSAGRTADPWWGPPVEDVIQELAAQGHPAVLVCSAGFVADHLEVLFDLDIEAQADRRTGGDRLRPHADAQRRPRVPGRARRGRAGSSRRAADPRGVTVAVPRVAIIGGGVTGLTVAYRLTRTDPSIDVTVFERGSRPGGKLRTVEVGGLLLPAGADSFLARKPWAVDLCKELGMADELVAPGATGAHLWTDTGLVAMPKQAPFGIPGDIGQVFRWPGLTGAGRRRAAQDLLRKKRKDDADETLGVAAPPAPRRRGHRPSGRPRSWRGSTRATSTGCRCGRPSPSSSGGSRGRGA